MNRSTALYLIGAVLFLAGVILWVQVYMTSTFAPPAPVAATTASVVGAMPRGGAPAVTTPVTLTARYLIEGQVDPSPLLYSKPGLPCWYGIAGSPVVAQYDPVAHTLTVPCLNTTDKP